MLRRKINTFGFILAAAAIIFCSSCKEKDPGPGPVGPEPGDYTLQLRADDTLFYEMDNVIIVRTFTPNGQTGVNAQINSICGSGPSNVTGHVDGQSDTIAHPVGSNPPLRYYGLDTTITWDFVTSYWVDGADTLATTTIAFKLAWP